MILYISFNSISLYEKKAMGLLISFTGSGSEGPATVRSLQHSDFDVRLSGLSYVTEGHHHWSLPFSRKVCEVLLSPGALTNPAYFAVNTREMVPPGCHTLYPSLHHEEWKRRHLKRHTKHEIYNDLFSRVACLKHKLLCNIVFFLEVYTFIPSFVLVSWRKWNFRPT